jgi:hypothetical protein
MRKESVPLKLEELLTEKCREILLVNKIVIIYVSFFVPSFLLIYFFMVEKCEMSSFLVMTAW